MHKRQSIGSQHKKSNCMCKGEYFRIK